MSPPTWAAGVVEGYANSFLSLVDLGAKISHSAFGTSDPDVGTLNTTRTGSGGTASTLTEFLIPYLLTEGAAGGAVTALKGARAARLAFEVGEGATKLERAVNFGEQAAKLIELSNKEKIGVRLGSAAVADFAGFTGRSERFSNLINDKAPALSNPLTRYLAADPNDHWAEARFKAAVEGLGLGLATEGILAGAKLMLGIDRGSQSVTRQSLERMAKYIDENAKTKEIAGQVTGVSPNITNEQVGKVLLLHGLIAEKNGTTLEKYLGNLNSVRETVSGELPGKAALGQHLHLSPVEPGFQRITHTDTSKRWFVFDIPDEEMAKHPEYRTTDDVPREYFRGDFKPGAYHAPEPQVLAPLAPEAPTIPLRPEPIDVKPGEPVPATSTNALPLENPTVSLKEPVAPSGATDSIPLEPAPSPEQYALKNSTKKVRGYIQSIADGQAIIYLHKTADVSTFAHEMFHYGRLYSGVGGELQSALTKAFGGTDGVFSPKVEEDAASAFERYLYEGKAPVKELEPHFAKLRDWMVNVYKGVNNTAIGGEVSPEVRNLFNQMLGFGPDAKAGKPALAQGALQGDAFYKKYPYQHTLLRDASDETIDKIVRDGFDSGIGPNATLATKGPPTDIIQKKYGTKAGRIVLALPEEAILDTPNGPKIKSGYKPTRDQFIKIERDYEPLHEAAARNKPLAQHSNDELVPAGKAMLLDASFPDGPPPPREATEGGSAAVDEVTRQSAGKLDYVASRTLAQKAILPDTIAEDLAKALDSKDPIENGAHVFQAHFNGARVDLTDGGQKFFDIAKEALDEHIFNRRDGVVPRKVTEEAARSISAEHGTSFENTLKFLSSMDKTTRDLAEKHLAGRMLTTSTFNEASKLSLAAANNPLNRALQEQADEAAIQMGKALVLTNNSSTEIARALDSHNITSAYVPITAKSLKNLQDALQSGSPMAKAQLRRMLAVADDTQGVRRVLKWVDGQVEAQGSRLLSLHNEWWINSLLGGVKTHVTNFTSQLLQTFMLPAYRIAGGAMTANTDAMKSGFRAYANLVHSAMDVFEYTDKGLRINPDSSVGNAIKAWVNEQPILDHVTKVDGSPRFAWTAEKLGVDKINHPILAGSINYLGKAIRLPTRFLTGMDELFKQVNYRAWLRDEAYQEAFRQGLHNDPQEFASFVNRYMEDGFGKLGQAANESALLKAKQATFTQDLVEGSLVKTISDGVQKHPILRTVIPFIKVPTNLLKTARDFTPGLNLMFKDFREQFFSPDAMIAADARGRAAVGTAFWSLAAGAAVSGTITGGGPKDPELRAAKMATGWRPYSLAVPGKNGQITYVDYRRMEPLAMLMGLSADFAEVAHTADQQTGEDLATAMTVALSKNLVNKTYVNSIAEVVNVLSDPDGSVGKFIRNRAAVEAVPGMIANLHEDDNLREVRTVMDAIRNRLPGTSDQLPPKRDLFGEPIQAPVGYPFDTFRYSTRVGDPVKEELAKLEFGFSQPQKKYQGVDLTMVNNPAGRSAYDYYLEQHGKVQIGGRTLPQALSRLIESDSYKALPDPNGPQDKDNGKVKRVQEVIGRYRDAAAREMLKAFPEVTAMKKALDKRKQDARRPVSNVLARLSS
jgi:hypothetical protein